MNDAERLRHDPAMRWIVGGKAAQGCAASPSQMGRFETHWLAAETNLSALADLSGRWINLVHSRRPPRGIVLDMDSSVSPTHGEQEMSVWNGHYECICYHPLFVFNQFGDLERCVLRPGNVHSADGWEGVLKPVIVRYRGKVWKSISGPMQPSPCRGSTSALRPSGSNTRSGCPPIRSFRTGSAICSSAQSDGRRTRSGGTTPISPTGRQAGRSRAETRLSCRIAFQMAEVAIPRQMFQEIAASDRGTTTAAATSARVRRRSSRIQKHPTGGVRPNASENSQINPSTIVRAARAAGSHPHLAPVLPQGRKSANISARSGVIWGIPDYIILDFERIKSPE